jgi:hypothetical protein
MINPHALDGTVDSPHTLTLSGGFPEFVAAASSGAFALEDTMKWYFIFTSGLGFSMLILFVGAAAFNSAWPETSLPLWQQMTIAALWGATGMNLAIRIWDYQEE